MLAIVCCRRVKSVAGNSRENQFVIKLRCILPFFQQIELLLPFDRTLIEHRPHQEGRHPPIERPIEQRSSLYNKSASLSLDRRRNCSWHAVADCPRRSLTSTMVVGRSSNSLFCSQVMSGQEIIRAKTSCFIINKEPVGPVAVVPTMRPHPAHHKTKRPRSQALLHGMRSGNLSAPDGAGNNGSRLSRAVKQCNPVRVCFAHAHYAPESIL